MEYLKRHHKTILTTVLIVMLYSLAFRSYVISIGMVVIVIYDLIKHYESWKMYDKNDI